MKLLVMIVLLTILEALSPMPGRAIQDDRNAKHNVDQKSKPDKPESPSLQTNKESGASEVHKRDGQAPADSEKENVKTVRVLPLSVKKDRFDFAYVLATLLLTVATLGIALLAMKQANAAKKSADIADKALRLTERADVLLYSVTVQLAQTQQLDGDTVITLHFKNFGPTRANKLKFWFYLDIPHAQRKAFPPPVPIALGAGDSQMLPFPRLRECMTQGTFRQIVNGTVSLSFDGHATYEDVFGLPHTIRCKGSFDPKRMAFNIDENEAD